VLCTLFWVQPWLYQAQALLGFQGAFVGVIASFFLVGFTGGAFAEWGVPVGVFLLGLI
jgi:hypothetical protein